LRTGEVADPDIGKREVRLRVRAAGVNWADCAITRGVPYFLRMAYGLGGPSGRG
jgi:NADPH:quinone reductase-like Zn-dependent oxidoreductase